MDRTIVIRAMRGVCLIAAVLGCAAGAAHAEDWLPVPAEQLQMTSVPEAPKAPAIYLYRQIDRDDTEHVEKVYVRLKILTDEGRSYANVSIPFDKQRESVGDIAARTIRPDGSVALFDGTVYEKPKMETRDTRVMTKTFTLSDVQAGSIIEYRYRQRTAPGVVYDSHWILSADLYTKAAQFSLIPYRGLTLRTSTPAGLPPGTELPKLDHGLFRLSAHDIPAFVREEAMPPPEELMMRVDFVYLQDRIVDKDAAAFWVRQGKESNSKVERFLDKQRAMQDAVAQIISSTDSPEDKLRKLYARSQQVRNLSYERARSAQEIDREGAKDNDDVQDVWKHGYGGRHQITWLFVALARAAGFQADPVLAATRSRFFFNADLQDPSQLNYAIAVVKLNGQDLFLDPGTPYVPFGALPWAITAVKGLRLDKHGGAWLVTPVPPASDSRVDRKANLRLAADGSLEGEVTFTFKGLQALTRRLFMRNEDDAARTHYLEEEIKADIPSASRVTLTNEPNWLSADATLTAQFTIKVPDWAAVVGQRVLVPAGLFAGSSRHAFEHRTRIHPVYVHYPFQVVDDIAIELPPGYQVESLPKPAAANISAANYSSSVQNAGRVLHLTREIEINTLMVPSKSYGTLQGFYESVRTGDTEETVLSADAGAAHAGADHAAAAAQ